MSIPLAPSRLPRVPAPPHDPRSTLLAGHLGPSPVAGWRAAELSSLEVDPATAALVLAPSPAAARWLSEPNGSLGGLRPPAHVTVCASGEVLLLDAASGELRRFDPCTCRFAAVPCFARVVEARGECALDAGATPAFAPRDRLLDPRGIAACGNEFYVADRGHGRVVRYALGTWVPRGVLRLPFAERDSLGAQGWRPTGLAVDAAGCLAVSDPVHGRVDRFDTRGRWIESLAAAPGATHVGIDAAGRIYVVVLEERTLAAPPAAATQTVEIDSNSEGFQWHALRVLPLATGARLALDVCAGDEPWSAALRDDPANPHWTHWLGADALERAAGGLPVLRAGRYLRLRLRPLAGHVPVALDLGASGARVLRFSGGGAESVPDARADRIGGFGPAPLLVDAQGRLHLWCAEGLHAFDASGEPHREQGALHQRFERVGRYVSRAIDAHIEACRWHRVELRGEIPAGTSVLLSTATADLELTDAEVAELPESAWSACEPARSMERGDALGGGAAWDALVPSQPGRFLWMRLELRGDGRETPRIRSALLEYPRVSLRRYLPAVFGDDPAGADFTDRFTAIFDRTLRSIEAHLDRLPLYFDPRSAPAEAGAGGADFLTWLGGWIGVTLARDWPEARRRSYLAQAAGLYPRRGTAEGLRRQLLLLLGFEAAYRERCPSERPRRRCAAPRHGCAAPPPWTPAEPPALVLEHFKLRRWLHVGHGRLGDDAVLWGRRIVGRSELVGEEPSAAGAGPAGGARLGATRLDTLPDPLRDPLHVHAHRYSVFVPAWVRERPAERRALEDLLARETPAHARADVRYVEPRYRVGVQASIGLDGVIARTPRGVRLAESRLRHGSVLGGRPRSPELEVGASRVGTTTRLT